MGPLADNRRLLLFTHQGKRVLLGIDLTEPSARPQVPEPTSAQGGVCSLQPSPACRKLTDTDPDPFAMVVPSVASTERLAVGAPGAARASTLRDWPPRTMKQDAPNDGQQLDVVAELTSGQGVNVT
jgi:hypothetical protein